MNTVNNIQKDIEEIILYPDRFRQSIDAPGFFNLSLVYEFSNKHLVMLCVGDENHSELMALANAWGSGSVIINTHLPDTPYDVYAVKDLKVKSLTINNTTTYVKRDITFLKYLRFYGRKHNIAQIRHI